MADTFKIKIAGQTREFESSLSNLNKAMQLLKSEGRSLDKSLKIDPSNAEAAAKLYANLSQRLALTRKQAAETENALSNIDPKVDLAGYVKASNKLNDLENEAKSLGQKLDSTFDEQHNLKVNVPKIDGSKITSDVDSAISTSASSMGSKFKSGVSGVTGAFRTIGGGLLSAFKGPIDTVGSMMNEVLIGGLRQVGSNIISKVGDSFKEVVGSMQDTQTAANGLKKVMDFSGISKDYKKLSGALNQTAIDTNISTKDADKFGSVLVGVGTNADKTAKIVDAAAKANQSFGGSGEAFSSVSLALGQIASSGKVTADNMNQITDANSALGASLKKQIYDNYKKAGGQAGSFNEAMSKSEISVEDLNTALVQVGDKGGKAIQTLPDAMDSFKETVGSKLQPAFDAITKSIAGVVSGATDWVQNFNLDPLIAKISSFDFGALFSNIGKTVMVMWSTIQQAFDGISAAFEAITGKPLTLSTAFQAAADIVGGIVNTIAGYASQIGNSLMTAFKSIDLKTVTDLFTQLGNLIGGTVNTAVSFFSSAIGSIDFNAVIGGVSNIIGAFSSLHGFINDSGISSALGSIFGTLISSVASIGGHIGGAIASIVNALRPAAKAIKPLVDGIAGIFNIVVKTVTGMFNTVVDVVNKLITAFASQLGPGLKHFLEHVKPIVSSIKTVFKGMGAAFKWLAKKIIEPILIPVFKTLGKIIDGFFDILGKVLDKVHKVVKFGGKIAGSIGKLFGDTFNSQNIDSKVKNYASEVNNSSSTTNQDNVFNISGVSGMNLMQLARKIAELQKSGVV